MLISVYMAFMMAIPDLHHAASNDEEALPVTVCRTILSRLAGIGATALGVARCLAMTAAALPMDVLILASASETEDLTQALEELEAAGLVHRQAEHVTFQRKRRVRFRRRALRRGRDLWISQT